MRKLHVVNINGNNLGFSEKKHAAQLLALIPNAIGIETNYDNVDGTYRTSIVESEGIETVYSLQETMTQKEYETAKQKNFETVPKKKDDISVEDIPF